MNYGVAIFFTDSSIGPVEMGIVLEERGFESLWAPEHSHIPLTRKSPYPQGGDLPKKYYDAINAKTSFYSKHRIGKEKSKRCLKSHNDYKGNGVMS